MSESSSAGVKGIGEAGTIASTPAAINAIADALSPLGINDVEMPATPERIWELVSGSQSQEPPSSRWSLRGLLRR